MNDDLIRRQTVIDYFEKAFEQCWTVQDTLDGLEELPAEERKKGRWIPDNRFGGGYWVCSSCKNPTEAFAANVLYKYCPVCGADMRGEKK